MDSIIPLPLTPETDPREPRLEDAVARVEAELLNEGGLTAQDKLQALASHTGNLAEAMDAATLSEIGEKVVDDYAQDKKDRSEWEKTAQEALERAAQERPIAEKGFPWPKASNVDYPLLASAMLQFNARSYPAVVKGDEAVLCKVIGKDEGRPQMGPQGPIMAVTTPEGQTIPIPPGAPPPPPGTPVEPLWAVPSGAKGKRAQRVSEYMNTTLFYRMYDWESDTDSLLMQLPVVGCAFRKIWYDPRSGEQKAAFVSALRVIVPEGARSCETTPRLTEEVPDVFSSEVTEGIRTGKYLDVDLYTKMVDNKPVTEGEDKPRLFLEQHRLLDLDEDGYHEPYIVTVDHETRKVLRIEANFGPGDVKLNDKGEVASIAKGKFFIKYPFWPHPAGKFYDLGLGHLLKQIGDVVNTAMNQLIDAGTAQTAGGGFIASGVRLQSRGQGSVIRTEPGVWKTVDVAGNALREAMVPFTLPNVSPVTYQVLDLILGAAKELSGIKDVITGEASNTGQVGTTLALIEQGLQVFNAIYKRVFRSLKEEFTLLYANMGKYGGEQAAQDYLETLDDPEADFAADFSAKDIDIRPVSDPSAVTRMQKMARAQFIMGTMEQLMAVGGDARDALRRVYEAADVEDIDKLLPPPPPPDPMQQAAVETQMRGEAAKAAKDETTAGLNVAKTETERVHAAREAAGLGMDLGMATAA